ncbi:hypothetical protein AB0J28_04150 [Streptosporangium canum]|uniref:hypothetical protein n=1 Tax=Streptosporangium canum TaxID=324952 RepID=UPI00342C509F
MLDHLASLNLLAWRWGYKDSRAIYWVTEQGKNPRRLDTKQAEELVLRQCERQGIIWLPIPPPGGETQRSETLRKIEELRRGLPAQTVAKVMTEAFERIHPERDKTAE